MVLHMLHCMIMQESKLIYTILDSYDLSLEEILTLLIVKILNKSGFTICKNNYYYNIFFQKSSSKWHKYAISW